MIVPLNVREQTLGAIAFASAESGRVYGPDDLALAEELGLRAAVAVDNARLYGRLHETEADLRVSRDQLQAILDGVADAVTAQGPDGRLVYANDAAARSLGYESADDLINVGASRFMERYLIFDEDGKPFPVDRLPGRLALRGEDPEPTLLRYHDTETGVDMWSLIKATAIRDGQGRPILAINVIEDVTEQREREQQLRFLADTGKVLAGSLAWERTFPEIARLVVRDLADWCAIEVLEDDGSVRLAAYAHFDPEKQALGEDLAQRYPASGERGKLRGALASGRSELRTELSDVEVAGAGRDPEHLAALLELGLRSALAVPMIARGKVVGAISMVSGDEGRRFHEDDLVLAEELAGRCGLALDNARLFRERSRIARTLQESLLPPMLPELPGLDLSARFRAAGEGLESGRRLLRPVRDRRRRLGGRDRRRVRQGQRGGGDHGARALHRARGGDAPGGPVADPRAAERGAPASAHGQALLHRAVRAARAQRTGHWFEFASGGHPLPLVLRAESESGEVGTPGTLLGIVPTRI